VRERWAVLAMALAAFALSLNTNVMGALMPFLGDGSQPLLLSKVEKGWLLSAAAGASAVAALLAGPLADRRGRRGPLLTGLALFSLASAAHVPAGSFGVLLAARIISGGAVGIAYACASALVADLVPYARRAAAMGVFTAGMFLAVPIGLPLAVWFANTGNWRAIFWVQTGVGIFALLLGVQLVPSGRSTAEVRSPLAVLGRPGVMAALLATMLHVGSFFTTVQLAGDWLDGAGTLRKDDQYLLWIVLGFASVLGSILLAPMADRMGKRNFVLMATIPMVACLLLLARVATLGALLPAGLALAVVAAARTGPLQALVSGLVPGQEQATLMGLRAGAQQVGVTVFAVAAGSLYQGFGFDTVLLAAACCQALTYVAIRYGVKERA
jgi:DHA1 family inner membrane transport protein